MCVQSAVTDTILREQNMYSLQQHCLCQQYRYSLQYTSRWNVRDEEMAKKQEKTDSVRGI